MTLSPARAVRILRVQVATVAAVARNPRLWPTAVRQWRRLTPVGWWRRPPFLPLPDHRYMAFRLVTQYGDPEADATPDDVIWYLSWCRAMSAGRSGTVVG